MKKVLLGATIAASVLSAQAFAEITANIGITSDYIFRGVAQSTSATASAGIDFSESGFYAGAWAADLDNGSEVDIYGGYIFETDSFSIGGGATSYIYTSDILEDAEVVEGNVYVGFGPVSLEYSFGEFDNDIEYSVIVASIELENGFRAKAGGFGKDAEGNWVELGFGADVGGFDAGIDLIYSSKKLNVFIDDSDTSIVFSLGKEFNI